MAGDQIQAARAPGPNPVFKIIKLPRKRDLARRIENARGELEKASRFDYIVVNENLEQAIDEVRCIVMAEGRRTARAIDLSNVIRQLQRRIDEILAEDFDFTRK